MDPAQIILFVVVLVLTVLLVVLGIQVFYVLKEFRHTLEKTNRILDTAGQLSENLVSPINAFSSIFGNVKAGSVLAALIKKVIPKDSHAK